MVSHPVSYQLKPWQVALLLTFWVSWFWLGSAENVPAASDLRLESRLNRLESDINRLNSQVSRIASQLSIPQPMPQSPLSSPPAVGVEPSLEEQFDNLATLAVETKLQVRQLANRVDQLEQAVYGTP